MIRTSPDSNMHRSFTDKGAFGSDRTGVCGAIASCAQIEETIKIISYPFLWELGSPDPLEEFEKV